VHDLEAHPVGWNVGLLYHLKEISTSVGLQFRSELQAKFNGSADFTGPAGPPVFGNTRFHTSIKFPPQLILGISTKAIPRWTVNADIEWEGWRTVGSIPKSFDTTVGSAVPQSNLNQRGLRFWKNSYVFRLGAEYAATDRLALRGGFFYDQTPIPKETFDPTIPNADLYAMTVGAGYRWEATSVDIAYLFGFYEKRAIDSSTLNPDNLSGTTTLGSYSTTAQVLVLSVTYRF
jgi:long-chain fatty acid transport protein